MVSAVTVPGSTVPGSTVPGSTVGPADPGPYLYEVRFVVVDVETTGGTAENGALIEVAAAAYQGGERLDVVDSLVDPHVPIDPFVSGLTGITDAMVQGAPALGDVLVPLDRLADGAVMVGHNVAFDVGFLDAGLARLGRAPLANPCVDTLALARRLVRDLVPDCTLSTLATALRLEHRPRHRAMADVLATADLLHRLIEVATGYGVLRLGDLLALPERLAPLPGASRAGPGCFSAA